MDSVNFNKNLLYFSNQVNDTRKKDVDPLNDSTVYLTRNYVKAAAISTIATALIAGLAIAFYQYAQSEGSFNNHDIQDITQSPGHEIPVDVDGNELKPCLPDEAPNFQSGEPSVHSLFTQKSINEENLKIFEKCCLVFQNAKYEGVCVNGQQHGQGKMIYANSDVYEGNYEKGLRHGYGVFKWVNGSVYEGNYEKDLRHGYGLLKWADGIYKGNFENDQYHGYGVLKWADGIYKGNFENGVPHGYGEYNWPSDEKYHEYKGDVEKNQFHGFGVYTYADGRIYKGEFKNDLFDGCGEANWTDGSYKGEFKNDLRHGQGEIIYKDGTVYRGEWQYDLKNGYGELIDIAGRVFKGHFSNNTMGEGEWS